MRRPAKLIALALVVLFSLSSCAAAVPQADYDALKTENETLKAEVALLKAELESITALYSKYEPAETQIIAPGETATIETEWGIYHIKISATTLSADAYTPARYLIKWEVYNESFENVNNAGCTISADIFQVFDEAGYLCDHIYTSDSINPDQLVPPGRRCLSQACWRIVTPNSKALEVSFPDRNIIFEVNVE